LSLAASKTNASRPCVCVRVCVRVCVCVCVCVRVRVCAQYSEVRTAQLINLDIDDSDDMQTQV